MNGTAPYEEANRSCTSKEDKCKRLLLAIDGSMFSEAATQAVIARAKPRETEVRVVHMIDILSPRFPEMMAYYPGVEHSRDAQRGPPRR